MSTGTAYRRVLAGRLVTHTVGPVSQTFGITTPDNRAGAYETVFRFPRSCRLVLADVPDAPDVAALRAWFSEHGGVREGDVTAPPAQVPVPLPRGRGPWLDAASAAVERALDLLVEEFAAAPYLHRVEHSLHTRLVHLLLDQDVLAAPARLAGGQRTQLVHKEWPEARVWTDRGRHTRGLFDVVVLDPHQLGRTSVTDFLDGRVAAPLGIEVGLDYPVSHLRQDVGKLRNSGVRRPYVLHLHRGPVGAAALAETEAYVRGLPVGLGVAYVQHTADAVRLKRVRDVDVDVRPV